MIQFPEARDVFLRNAKTRMEKHGNEDRAVLDLAIAVTGQNSLLDMIHPELCVALFKSQEKQRTGEIAADQTDLPLLRFSRIATPINFDIEHAGMSLKVHYGATGKADMAMVAVKLSKVSIEKLIEGGSVELRFNLSTLDVSEKIIGKLSLLQQHTISIELTPPEVEETPIEKQAKAKAEAEQLFGDAAPQQTPEQALIDSAQ